MADIHFPQFLVVFRPPLIHDWLEFNFSNFADSPHVCTFAHFSSVLDSISQLQTFIYQIPPLLTSQFVVVLIFVFLHHFVCLFSNSMRIRSETTIASDISRWHGDQRHAVDFPIYQSIIRSRLCCGAVKWRIVPQTKSTAPHQ